MIYKCNKCGSALEYSAELNKMVCDYCGNTFELNEVSAMVQGGPEKPKEEERLVKPDKPINAANTGIFYGFNAPNGFASNQVGDYNTVLERKKEEEEAKESREHASIQMQIMRCTSCGAELAVNGVETSTFCAYCGQATVVKDRVADYLKPDYIIPFRINRTDAEAIIRRQLNSGFFVPKGIKEFEVEKMRGIYVPFWLFDMYYHDSQYYKYTKKQGKSSVTRYEHFVASTNYRRLTLDASLNLNDESSARLEPYDMRQLKEFDTAYLSGFYSDRFDVGVADITGNAVLKAGHLFNEEAAKMIRHKGGKLVSSDPDYQVTNTNYALLPAWFLTFRYENKPFTILVNGQTGKMIGAVPFVKAKVYGLFAAMVSVLTVLSVILVTALSKFIYVNLGGFNRGTALYFIGLPVVIGIIAKTAFSKYTALKKSLKLTTANKINKFAKERTDK